jgi:hypothetical protein
MAPGRVDQTIEQAAGNRRGCAWLAPRATPGRRFVETLRVPVDGVPGGIPLCLPATAEALGVLVDGVPVGTVDPGRLDNWLPPAA